MYTALLVRRHINRLKDDKPFSIRDFLNYGSRNAIDQIFHRLVKSGLIIRVAIGIFIKDASLFPSALDVALVKATAFGKSIVTHGLQAAQQLKLSTNTGPPHEATYACSGSSSSFRFGNIRILFIASSPRKMGLGNELSGLAIRALWHLRKPNCSCQLICDAMAQFNRPDRQALRENIKTMPAWLASYFIGSERSSAQRQRLKNRFLQYYFYWNSGL